MTTRKTIFYVKSNGPVPPCPFCHADLSYRDSRRRVSKLEGGAKRWLIIRRFCCGSCKALHTELPDCLAPYKHYQTEIISGVIDGVITQDDLESEDYPCLDTMRLWLAWFTQNLERMEGLLHKALYEISGNIQELQHPSGSLLEKLRRTTLNWLEQALRTIYNSGGFLVPVRR